jgi:2-polyprenyl-3-methyl-5-hydroxy-6-metoxy-1,4-benzoquinol methylase
VPDTEGLGLREDYGESYKDLYERHWWWRARERIILDVLRARQPTHGWKRILDVGCGNGLFFDQLQQFGEVVGVEAAESLVSQDGTHRSRIHVGPFDSRLQLSSGFSLVLMLDVLEHLADPGAALRYALQLLVPGGTVLITLPAFNGLWTNHDVINQHCTRYTKKTFDKLAHEAGLPIEIERYFFHWLFPVKIAARLVEHISKSPPSPARVPNLWINKLLYRLSRFEDRSWGRLPLPFGSSLMVLGRKPLDYTSNQ